MTDHAYNHELHESQIQEVRNSLTRIEARIVELTSQVRTTNGRVTSLEKWKYGLGVGMVVLVAVKSPELVKVIAHLWVGG